MIALRDWRWRSNGLLQPEPGNWRVERPQTRYLAGEIVNGTGVAHPLRDSIKRLTSTRLYRRRGRQEGLGCS